MGPLQVWPMVYILYISINLSIIMKQYGGSKNVTYTQQTTDKKVNTEPL